MTSRTLLALVAVAGIVAALLAAAPAADAPARHSFDRHVTDACDSVLNTVATLERACRTLDDSASVDRARRALRATRRAYKAIEPMATYLDNSFVMQFVNGAPLPRLDPKSQYVDILPPTGLQVLDELLYRDVADVIGSADDVRAAVDAVAGAMPDLVAVVRRARPTDRMLLEMSRMAVMRSMAMGLTGFDLPASAPHLADEAPALRTVALIVPCFADRLRALGKDTLGRRAVHLAERAIATLEADPDFDTFDRAEAIRTTFDPFYGALADIHAALGVEYADEVTPAPQPIDGRARSMFATNTLDPYTWTGLSRHSATTAVADLGRTLFFDPILSANNDRSCASCHQPERAFTDGQARSVAFDHQGTIDRNAPTLVNAVFARRFFADLRANRIADVLAHVVTNRREFGSSLIDMVGRLRSSTEYERLFAAAFPGEQATQSIDVTNVGRALAAYLATLISFDSPVDRYLRGENVALADDVRRGFNLFMGRAACATCHFPPTFAGYVPPTFTDSESEILGVATRPDTLRATLDPDVGRAGGILREQAPIYANAFKTPTIRNVSLTAPYMHHGAYPTLRDVMTFYDMGGGRGIGIDHPYQTLAADRLDFSKSDHDDLIAFMEALTDTSGTTRRPQRLPRIDRQPALDKRTIGGTY